MTTPTVPPIRPTLFYVKGTINIAPGIETPGIDIPGIPFLHDVFNGTAVQQYYDLYDVDYPAAVTPGGYSLQTGIANTISGIRSRPGPFVLSGHSQGAAIVSFVYNEIRYGSLQDRRADLIAGITYGNPNREAGHTIPGGIDPGGHGLDIAENRLVDTEELWWDFAAPGDIATVNGDDAASEVASACYEFMFGSYAGTYEALTIAAQEALSEYPPELVASTIARIIAGMLFIIPHVAYEEYKPIQGDSRGAIQVAVDHLVSLVTFTPQPPSVLHLPAPTPIQAPRFHFWVEDIHGNILTKDLIGTNVNVVRTLSGPAQIQLDVSPYDASAQAPDGSGPIIFKPWGHIIHAAHDLPDGSETLWASGIVVPSQVDPNTDVMTLKAEGFSNYAKGLPWLEDWNPIAIDPFEIVTRIWAHIQSYANGNLGVTVTNYDGTTPAESGLEMLPGFSFQDENFVQDFFAIFIRASDRNDCGDYINKLAQQIPFDYWEEAVFNTSTNKVDKSIKLAYPYGGTIQEGLIFRLGENVKQQTQKIEAEIDWLSDITVKGYFPGQEYDSEITNADPDRLRRVMDETDLHIDSNERAAAWAKKRLTRRQIPHYFESIQIDPFHPNAPFGSFDVGDIINIQGPMAWHGMIDLPHKIMMHGWDETKATVQLNTKAQGMFNYDPIEYVAPGDTP